MTAGQRRSARALHRSLHVSLLPRTRPDLALRARRRLRRWGPTPAGACQAAAISDPRRLAIVDQDTALTFAEVDARTSALAAALHARGHGPRDTIAVMCANHHWLIELNIAACKLGMHLLYLSAEDEPDHVAALLHARRPALLVCDAEHTERLGQLSVACERLTAAPGAGPTAGTLDRLIDSFAPTWEPSPSRRPGRTVTLAVPVAQGVWRERSIPGTLLTPGVLTCTIPLRPRETTMLCAPMSSPWGHLHLTLALRLGSTLILPGAFQALEVLAGLERHHVDAIVLDDEMLRAIMSLPYETLNWYATEHLRVIAVREPALAGEVAIPAISRFRVSLHSHHGPPMVRLGNAVGGEFAHAA